MLSCSIMTRVCRYIRAHWLACAQSSCASCLSPTYCLQCSNASYALTNGVCLCTLISLLCPLACLTFTRRSCCTFTHHFSHRSMHGPTLHELQPGHLHLHPVQRWQRPRPGFGPMHTLYWQCLRPAGLRPALVIHQSDRGGSWSGGGRGGVSVDSRAGPCVYEAPIVCASAGHARGAPLQWRWCK